MDSIKTIVIVGGEGDNQAKLQTQLKPVKIAEGVGLAITSIYHGEVYNITESNNTVEYYAKGLGEKLSVSLPSANYPTTVSLVRAISELIAATSRGMNRSDDRPVMDYTIRRDEIYVSCRNMILDLQSYEKSPWKLVGAAEGNILLKSFSVKNVHFNLNVAPAFLYVNIVENSYINGKLSRVLSVIPISMKPNWSYYEFVQPNFVPIDVKEFTKITLEIRNMDGQFVSFDPNFKTIITLQTKPINRVK